MVSLHCLEICLELLEKLAQMLISHLPKNLGINHAVELREVIVLRDLPNPEVALVNLPKEHCMETLLEQAL